MEASRAIDFLAARVGVEGRRTAYPGDFHMATTWHHAHIPCIFLFIIPPAVEISKSDGIFRSSAYVFSITFLHLLCRATFETLQSF
jgi:hypothetical protein